MGQWKNSIMGLCFLGLGACGAEDNLGEDGASDLVETVEQEIIGGHAPYPNKLPWMARITRNGSHWCGGTLVHPSWVLTAAHCVDGQTASSLRVIMGDHFTNANDGTEQTRTISSMTKHPNFAYSSGAPYNDLALIQVSTPFAIDIGAGTLALATATPEIVGKAAGWGWTTAPGTSSTVLQEANERVWSNSVCNSAPLARDLFSTELCGGSATSGVCHGDSGGPLYHLTNGRMTALGVVSWGRGGTCDSNQVFSRVQSFRTWIENTVAVPLRRNIRFPTSLTLSTGTVQLRCQNSNETQTASLTVKGLELSLNCPSGPVQATCNLTNPNRFIDGFTRTMNGVTTSLPHTNSNASDSFVPPANTVVEYRCLVTD